MLGSGSAFASGQSNASGQDAHEENHGIVEEEPIIMNDIVNPVYFCDPLDSTEMRDRVVDAVTSLRCDVSLPETKLAGIIDVAKNLLNAYQRFAMGKIKNFAKKKGMDEHDEDFVEFINSLEPDDSFTDVRTPESNLSYLTYKSDGSVPSRDCA